MSFREVFALVPAFLSGIFHWSGNRLLKLAHSVNKMDENNSESNFFGLGLDASSSFLALMHNAFLIIKLIAQIPKTTTTTHKKTTFNKTANII